MKHIRKLSRAIAVTAAALTLASCQRSLAMWVIPGSTAENLIFGWSTTRNGDEKVFPSSIRVYPCDSISRRPNHSYYPGREGAVWDASSPLDAVVPSTNRLNYGQGFAQSEAKPLAVPGCYVVYASARHRGGSDIATMGFRIAASGAVSDMPEDEYEELFRE
jgi:hypothetical protein